MGTRQDDWKGFLIFELLEEAFTPACPALQIPADSSTQLVWTERKASMLKILPKDRWACSARESVYREAGPRFLWQTHFKQSWSDLAKVKQPSNLVYLEQGYKNGKNEVRDHMLMVDTQPTLGLRFFYVVNTVCTLPLWEASWLLSLGCT